MKSGDIRAFVSTNALELGIDVGSLDCCVLLGYPGSQSSLQQQVGRCGFLGKPVEASVVPYSATVTRMHILAGTGELPCSAAELLPAQSPWAGQLKSMVSEGLLVPQGQPAGCELGAGCSGGSTFISPGFVPNVKKLLG